MSDDEPFPLYPENIEDRGEFPEHDDTPQPLRTADEAREFARRNLERWRAEHGERD